MLKGFPHNISDLAFQIFLSFITLPISDVMEVGEKMKNNSEMIPILLPFVKEMYV